MMNTLFSRVYCLDSGFHTGEENMEVDRRLMSSFLDGRFQKQFGPNSCLWRFYAWRPYAITLGYNQDVLGIDSDKCRSAGIDVVRRPTGGRAVFHAEEFTYSFFAESPEQNSELYRMVHEVIKLALESLDIHAEFCRSTLTRPQGGGSSETVSCFTASARYELQVEGRKLVGSAQRRTRNVLLQHGSLPLSSRHKELCTFVALSDGEAFEEIRNEMERKTTSLEEIMGYIPEYSRLVEFMRSALGKVHGVDVVELQPDELSELIK
ncbi:MAG: biotin/lipoate A/B protein ligase family protein [Chlorobiaceae bacterium]|jgi:lipoate-protein ligase A